MKKFEVMMLGYASVTVEAEDKDEAEEKALEAMPAIIGDVDVNWEAEETEEVEEPAGEGGKP